MKDEHAFTLALDGAGPVQDGARKEFENFYRASFQRVARAVFLVLGSREDAADVAQESFVKAWIHWDRLKSSSRRIAFTLKVAQNLSKSRLRRRLTLQRLLPKISRPLEDRAWDDDAEFRVIVTQALRQLSIRQRWAVVLIDFLGLESGEAATILGIAPATVRVHVSRARGRIRAALAGSPKGVPAGNERHRRWR